MTTATYPSDTAEGEPFMRARRLALPALERKGAALLDDVAVPIGRIPELLEAIEAVADRTGLVIGTFGHAGDGNMHPTIVSDPHDASSRERAKVAFGEIVHKAVELGGTVTGELRRRSPQAGLSARRDGGRGTPRPRDAR